MASKKIEMDEKVQLILLETDNMVEEYKALEQEIAELEQLGKAKIEKIQEEIDAKVLGKKKRQEQLCMKISINVQQVPQKEAKTQSKVELVSGDVVIKKAKKELAPNKEKLLDWARENALDAYIKRKIVEELDWAKLKSELQIVDEFGENTIIHKETGEIMTIDGLDVKVNPEELQIK